MGVIRPNLSPHNHPIVVVKKESGEYVFAFTVLNSHIRLLPLKVERIDDLLVKLTENTCSSSLNLVSSYFQVPFDTKCQDLVSFTFEGRMYSFRVMPFGCRDSGASLMAALKHALGEEILEQVVVWTTRMCLQRM